jgi:hypothetical protein
MVHQLQEYLRQARERFPQNLELDRITTYAVEIIRMCQLDDKWTERNEYRYRGKTINANRKQRERAETRRRALGVPTAQEALAILHAKNALRREGLPTDPMAYAGQEAIDLEILVGTEKKAQLDAIRKFDRDFAEYQRQEIAGKAHTPTRSEIKFPRVFEDDKELEFETLEDLPKPADTNLTAAPSFSLDEPEDKY